MIKKKNVALCVKAIEDDSPQNDGNFRNEGCHEGAVARSRRVLV